MIQYLIDCIQTIALIVACVCFVIALILQINQTYNRKEIVPYFGPVHTHTDSCTHPLTR